MTIRRQSFWIAVALAALTVLLYVWWIDTHEKRWFDRLTPVEGEASYNDYYVVQQALRAQGVRVQSLPHLPAGIEHWSGRDTLLLGSDPKTLSPRQVDALLEWVARGGRLLVATAYDRGENHPGFLARIGIVPKQDVNCMKWQAANGSPSQECFGTFDFQASERENFEAAIGNSHDGWIAARRRWGDGQIEAVGDFELLHNYAQDSSQHSDWAWQLLAPMLQGGIFHIVYQTELPPLYVYLIRYGWFALLPLLIALLAWLWARSERFGPTLPLPAPDRRALGEHIQASGEYLYRRGLAPALYAPLRRRFDEQLRRRDPELAALPPADIARELAQRQRLPLSTVQQALRTPQPKQRAIFLSTVQTLLHLTRHL
jgi:hypothetical protein